MVNIGQTGWTLEHQLKLKEHQQALILPDINTSAQYTIQQHHPHCLAEC